MWFPGLHSTSHQSSILYIVSIVYICQSQSPNSSHLPFLYFKNHPVADDSQVYHENSDFSSIPMAKNKSLISSISSISTNQILFFINPEKILLGEKGNGNSGQKAKTKSSRPWLLSVQRHRFKRCSFAKATLTVYALAFHTDLTT